MRIALAGCCLALAACGLTPAGDVVLGPNDGIPPINVDQYFRNLPQLSETQPPDGPISFQGQSNTTYTANLSTNADGSRTLTFSNTVVVFDEQQSRQVSSKLSGLDIDAVQSVTVTITTFALKDATQTSEPPVDLSGVEDLTIAVNGNVVLTKADLVAMQSGQPVVKTLTQQQVAPFTQAIKAGTAASAKLDVNATVTQQTLTSFPTSVHLIVQGQPTVDVSVLKAAGINL